MTDFRVTLTENILLQESRTSYIGLSVKEQLAIEEAFSSLFRKVLLESVDLAEEVSLYLTEPHETFIWNIYRNGILLDEIDSEEVLQFEVKKTLTDEVGQGYVTYENADLLDIREGDQIEFKYQSEGNDFPVRVFLGEIDQVEKIWNQEEAIQNLKVSFQGWGKILLEQKITKSFPQVTNVNTIINSITEDVQSVLSWPYIKERKIGILEVETYTKTRTIDFVGESLWDALAKLAFITRSEFHIDPNKQLHFFSRENSVLKGTLDIDDFFEYGYEERDDLICNTCRVYGHPNKIYPLPTENNPDPWTDSIEHWSCTMDPQCPISATTIPPPYLGNYIIKVGIAGTTPPETADWKFKYWNFSFTQSFPGTGMRIKFAVAPPVGKSVEFSGMRIKHEGSSSCTLWYAFQDLPATSDSGWTQIGSKVEDGEEWRYLGTPVVGGIDQTLYLRWKTGNPALFESTTISRFAAKYRFVPFDNREELFNTTFTLPTQINAQSEEGYTELSFKLYSSIYNYSTGSTLPPNGFQVTLAFTDGHEAVYKAEFQGLFLSGWSAFNLPIGPDVEGWTGNPQGTISAIDFTFTMITNAWNNTDFICIDGLCFDKGKWYGIAKDDDSMQTRENGGYGIKFKKIFDDTLYSDTAAQRWADETIERFKEPLYFLTDGGGIFDNLENYEVGDLVALELPEHEGKEYQYRILSIQFNFSQEDDLNMMISLERTSTYKDTS